LAVAVTGAGLAIAAARRLRRRPLAGHVVLITGGSRGLGLEMARQAAARGARVAICGRDVDSLEEARSELARDGTEVLAVPCDVGDASAVGRMLDQVRDKLGEVDVLIANAGVITVGPLADQTVDDFHEAMDVMYWGVVHPVLGVLPAMRARRDGSIAIVTSIGGRVSVPHLLPYAGAKFAAVGFAEGLRADVARDGVRVTHVVPGLMRTGSHLRAYFKGRNRAEFSWFAVAASLPFLSADVRHAAGQVLDAVERGSAEIVIGLPAKVISTVHGLMPATTMRVLSGFDRLLPKEGGIGEERLPGSASQTPVTRSPLTAFGRRAAERQHQS
jgi:short-subunit dehydrogenase